MLKERSTTMSPFMELLKLPCGAGMFPAMTEDGVVPREAQLTVDPIMKLVDARKMEKEGIMEKQSSPTMELLAMLSAGLPPQPLPLDV